MFQLLQLADPCFNIQPKENYEQFINPTSPFSISQHTSAPDNGQEYMLPK